MLDRLISEAPRFFDYYNILFYLKAMGATFALSAVGCAFGFLLGFLIAVTRGTTGWALAPVRLLGIGFVETFRRIPFLVTLMLVFFAANVFKLDIPLFTIALVAVSLIASAYLAEIVRAGIDSVHRSQWDSTVTMNMSRWQSLWYVVMPQSWKVILPPTVSFMVLYVKDTALASHIGVAELTYAGKVFNTKGFSPFLSFGTVLVLYFAMCYPLTRFGAWLEHRLATARHR